jgi:hypothetical protein
MPTRALVLIALALACFAGNSLLCRLALAGRAIDAATFTAVRIVTGAAVLALFWFWAEYDDDGDPDYSGRPDVCVDCHCDGSD